MNNVKKIVDFVFGLVQTGTSLKLEGGKFSYRNLLGFGPAFMGLPDAISSFKDAVKEVETADDAARKELIGYINKQFSLEDKGLEAKIEAALSLLIKLSGCGAEFKALLAKAASSAAVLPAGTAQVNTVNVKAENVNVVK